MRHLLLAGVIVLTSTATTAAQEQPILLNSARINLTFLDAPLEDALTAIARISGLTIEFDGTVTEEMRRALLAKRPIRIVNGTIAEALDILTETNGLIYTSTGPKAIRISKKP
jgi:hypothetical protein